MKRLALIAALLLAPCAQAQLLKLSGSDVLRSYQQYPAWTSGFVFGTVAASRNKAICAPSSWSQEQVEAMVKKYLADHPGRLHLPFVDLADEALIADWPCRR